MRDEIETRRRTAKGAERDPGCTCGSCNWCKDASLREHRCPCFRLGALLGNERLKLSVAKERDRTSQYVRGAGYVFGGGGRQAGNGRL